MGKSSPICVWVWKSLAPRDGMGWDGIGWERRGRKWEEKRKEMGREEGGKEKERRKKRIACIGFLGTWDGVGKVVDMLGQGKTKGERGK